MASEEFGIIATILLVGVFAFIVVRILNTALRERDIYIRLAASGLAMLFAVQSMINMMVTLQLVPAKGMTLPFISYGGSSLIAMSITMGFALALTRRRPESLRGPQTGLDLRPYSPARGV